MHKEHGNTHHERLSLSPKNIALFALVGFNILLTIYVAFFKKDTLWFETMKAGGSENFTKLETFLSTEAYKAQQTTMIDQYVKSANNQGTTNEQAGPTQQATNTTTADTAKIEAIISNGHIKGNKNARYFVLEYSDLLCPWCKRHYNAQTVETFVKNHDDVAMIFRQNPIPGLHPTAPKGAYGAYCAGKIGGNDAFYSYLEKAFQAEEFTDENVLQIAKDLDLNTSKFSSCYANQDTIAAVNSEIAEGAQFGVEGTPGNVLIDRETGKFILLPGAQQLDKFEAGLTSLKQ